MTIFELGALGEFIGAALLFGSLVYVGIQIKQNTAATSAQIYQARTDAFQTYARYMADLPDFFGILKKLDGLDNADLSKIPTLSEVELFKR